MKVFRPERPSTKCSGPATRACSISSTTSRRSSSREPPVVIGPHRADPRHGVRSAQRWGIARDPRCSTTLYERTFEFRQSLLAQDEGDLVDRAPGPVLAGVARGVLVGRGVTAADLAAGATDAQVHPTPAHLQALLTARHVRTGGHLGHLHLVEMGARLSGAHGEDPRAFSIGSHT